MFGPHLLTSEIQFGVCDELDAHSVTASHLILRQRAREREDKKTLENEIIIDIIFDIYISVP